MSNFYGTNGIVCSITQTSPSITGQVRFNGAMNQFEVNDGISWRVIVQNTSIGLDFTTQEVVTWASKKMREEQELNKLRNEFPAIDEAAKEVELAQTTLEAVKTLCSGTSQ